MTIKTQGSLPKPRPLNHGGPSVEDDVGLSGLPQSLHSVPQMLQWCPVSCTRLGPCGMTCIHRPAQHGRSPHAGCLSTSGRGCQAACSGGHLIRPLLDPHDWPSVVPPLKRDPQRLSLVVLMVHHDRCPEGTTSDPQRSQPPPGSGDPTKLRNPLGWQPDGQDTPHSTRLPVGPGSCHSTRGRTPCPNPASAAPQLPGPSQSPRGEISHLGNPLNLLWSKSCSQGTNSHQSCSKMNCYLTFNYKLPASRSPTRLHTTPLIRSFSAPSCSRCWP